MQITLQDRSALVTGAGSGIGRASAAAFAAAGAAVTVVDVNARLGHETVEQITAAGGTAQFVEADVTDESSVASAVSAARSAYGSLDYAHNNVGIEDFGVNVHEYRLEDWQRIISVNLTGVFISMKHELPVMLEAGAGSIVNTSSGLAMVGAPNLGGYCASKAGITGLTRVAAVEYAGRNIRVNAILPGGTDTPMTENMPDEVRAWMVSKHPVGRFAEPDEIAQAAVWLCSDAASFITGTLLPVDGGSLAAF